MLRKLIAALRLYLGFKRNKDMQINLAKALAILDAALAVAAPLVKLTPTTKDDDVLAQILALREKIRPLLGAGEGHADLPEETAAEVAAAVDNLKSLLG